MPTKIIFFIALLIVSVSARAQFHIGPKLGVNATKIDGKEFKKEFNTNYLIGGFAEIGFGDRVSINPEVLFGQSSATRDTAYNPSDIYNKDQVKAQYNFLSIPLLLNSKLAGPLHIEAGPQYSILLNQDKSLLQNGEEAFKNGEFALVTGLQLKISRFRLWGRYVVGLNSINEIAAQNKWRSQSLQASLGVAF